MTRKAFRALLFAEINSIRKIVCPFGGAAENPDPPREIFLSEADSG
jgi:hypothetical protein